MTLAAVLAEIQRAGVRLEVEGDRLVADAPKGVLTDVLKAELVHHKAALFAMLAPTTTGQPSVIAAGSSPAAVEPAHEYIALKGGLTVPAPALRLALALENRGFLLRVDADHQLVIQHVADVELTEDERLAIIRWHLHLAAIAEYRPPVWADPLRGRDG